MDGGQRLRQPFNVVPDTHAITASLLVCLNIRDKMSWDASIRLMVVGLGVSGTLFSLLIYCLVDTALSLWLPSPPIVMNGRFKGFR